MEEEEVHAYAAGVLDSDGYFTIVRDASFNPFSPYYRVKMGIKQLWPGQSLRFISGVLGGRVAIERRAPGQRTMARWELYNEDARAAIVRVVGCLLVKRRQAILLLWTQNLLADGSAPYGTTRDRVELYRNAVQMLNRGRHPTSTMTTRGGASLQQAHSTAEDQRNPPRIAYLAGVMDSDGYFKMEKRRVKGMINPFYRIKIGAGQVAPSPAIDLLAETFGGRIRVRGDGRKGHRPIAHWGLFDKSAVPALEALLPYLVIKAPQARLLLQLRELKARGKLGITEWTHKTRWHRPIKMRKRCYSKAQVRAFDRLYRTVKALHADSPPLTLPQPPD